MATASLLSGADFRAAQPLDPESLSLDHFKSLYVSAPIESTKFAFIPLFLSRVLNLKPETLLLDASINDLPSLFKKRPSQELLPQVAMPSDLWLVPEITIRNIGIKTAILREVNTFLLLYIESLQTNELFLIDDALISRLEKRIMDFHLTEFNSNHEPEPQFDSLNEADEYEENDSEVYSVFLRRSLNGNRDLVMSKTTSRPMSTASSKHRLSSFSRDFAAQRRKLSSFLGQQALAEEDKEALKPTTPHQNMPVFSSLPQLPPTGHKGENSGTLPHANGIFKSRIYSKIKKRRELASSVTSTANSVNSVNSSTSARRKSSASEIDPKTPGKMSPPLSEMQRADNQRRKHEYYLQTKMFSELTKVITGFVGRSGLRANLSRLMDFVKSSVFRFILVDTCQMIMDYGQYKLLHGTWRESK